MTPRLLFLCLTLSVPGWNALVRAQTVPPIQGMSYQALLRNPDGSPLEGAAGQLEVEVLDAADSVLWMQSIPVTTDAHGLIVLRIGGGEAWAALPWHALLQMRATWVGTEGPTDLGTQVLGEVPKSLYAGNGWFYQGPEDLRLVQDADTVRMHADSLVVIGNTRQGDTLLTEVVRLQAQRDVIFSARDDVSAFSVDDIKLLAGNDVRIESVDDVRMDALDDIRANALNELELVGVRRTNLGTAEGVVPASDTTVVMARKHLHIGLPVGVPLTGTPQDTIYLAETVRIAGQDILVQGPAAFDRPVSGVEGTAPEHFVTLSQLQALMLELQQTLDMWMEMQSGPQGTMPTTGEE